MLVRRYKLPPLQEGGKRVNRALLDAVGGGN
jgi:hypothetical protein